MEMVLVVDNGQPFETEPTGGQHECEVIYSGREHEAAERKRNWDNCRKNPGHQKFFSREDFVNTYLRRLQSGEKREDLRAMIDLTVKLSVFYVSPDRPDYDKLVKCRQIGRCSLGTGFIRFVSEPKYNKPCFCSKCHGKVARKQWKFKVVTARHVVYNTEEAEKTRVDLFYDDHSCAQDGTMKSVWGLRLPRSKPNRDSCCVLCVTCDESLGERIEYANRCRLVRDKLKPRDLLDIGLLSSSEKDCYPTLIVSHPHGEPKKITVGQLRNLEKDIKNPRIDYNTPTCPGSSGAEVFSSVFRFFSPVHSGTDFKTSTQPNKFKGVTKFSGEQINYGYDWLIG
ncbi:hypothetical protein ElyMa_005930500 [Elysia marginata]|uniref:Uncharacterized protein n=1 Tax=Elysia marginata TaxID=1093978 RepID=A0AAV4G873_9GAST|nr:hypothetical protein ElyMa_005930500 [Elysia marginata]